jgi:nickel/cobalt exporter
MILLIFSAAFVGLVHSLAPGHWLPVVLLAKSRRWTTQKALQGAVVAASGHILVSTLLGIATVALSLHYLVHLEEQIERYGSLILVFFGLAYALNAYFRHSHCHGHTHHGAEPPALDPSEKVAESRLPWMFLFTLGLSPCVAVLPVLITASAKGTWGVAMTIVAFAVGVLAALMGATLMMSHGLMKLDHPLFEHYGDVVTGVGVSFMGVALFLWP